MPQSLLLMAMRAIAAVVAKSPARMAAKVDFQEDERARFVGLGLTVHAVPKGSVLTAEYRQPFDMLVLAREAGREETPDLEEVAPIDCQLATLAVGPIVRGKSQNSDLLFEVEHGPPVGHQDSIRDNVRGETTAGDRETVGDQGRRANFRTE